MRSKSTLILFILFISASLFGLVALSKNKDTTEGSTSSLTNTTGTALGYYDNSMNAEKINKYSSAPATLPIEQITTVKILVNTNKGDFELSLDGSKAPKTVSNFVFLVKEKFYDGLTFHRYVEDFVIQGGDPQGDGTGGPGYTVPAEIGNGILHDIGTVAMARLSDEANPTRASSGSQFYITLAATPFLDDGYTTFGKVTRGFEVVQQLRQGDQIIAMEIID